MQLSSYPLWPLTEPGHPPGMHPAIMEPPMDMRRTGGPRAWPRDTEEPKTMLRAVLAECYKCEVLQTVRLQLSTELQADGLLNGRCAGCLCNTACVTLPV